MAFRPDFTIYDHEGRPSAMVEVKNKRGTTPQWAAALHGNWMAQGLNHPSDYFLLVTPDHMYIWKHGRVSQQAALPDHVIDSRVALKKHLESLKVESEKLTGAAFETLVWAWLSELLHSPEEAARENQWLVDIGLSEAARDGRIDYQISA